MQTPIQVGRHAQDEASLRQLFQDRTGVRIATPGLRASEMLEKILKARLGIGDIVEHGGHDAAPATHLAHLRGAPTRPTIFLFLPRTPPKPGTDLIEG